MILEQGDQKVEINDRHWPLAEGLFLKWGYEVKDKKIKVSDLNKITPELSAWGIPWKHI